MKTFSIKILLLGIWRFIKLLPAEYTIGLVIDLLEYIVNQTDNTWDNEQVSKLATAYTKVFSHKR